MKGYKMVYLIVLATLFFDQITKFWAEKSLILHNFLEITPFLNLFLTYNKGVSFSFLSSDTTYGPFLLSALSVVICIGLIYWLYKENNKRIQYGLALVIGGAIGNVIDRIRIGSVVDFIDFHYQTFHWPAFNIADTAICLGAFLIFLQSFKKKKDEK